MRLYSCRATGCKDLPYYITNDITTCNNDDFWIKSVEFMGLFYDFPSCFKDFIIIHEYSNNIICITYHVVSSVCLSFNVVPRLEV